MFRVRWRVNTLFDEATGAVYSFRQIAVREAWMSVVRIVVWEDNGTWLGYLQDYPDYWTQGETLDDLREHLRDLYEDIVGGHIPGIRKVEELVVT